MQRLGERTLTIDCDVLQADGGTRTAAITGSYVALMQAVHGLIQRGIVADFSLDSPVAATSVGIVKGELMLDLAYVEDSRADADFNVVMTGDGRFIEVQGTAEHGPFTRRSMDRLLELAASGIEQLIVVQRNALQGIGVAVR
jgi:ribonuclease PH